MTSPLFRQQALNQQRERLYGEVVIIQPLSFYLITFSVVVMVVVIGLLLIYGTYARQEAVQGYLVPDKSVVKIYAPLRGVLTIHHIKEGALVNKGDTLFTVSTQYAAESGGDRDALLLSELQKQQIDAEKKIEQERQLNLAKIQRLNSSASGLVKEQQQLKQSIATQQQLLNISDKGVKNLKTLLSQGTLSNAEYQQRLESHLGKKVNLQNAQRQLTTLNNRHLELTQQIAELPLRWQSRLADLNNGVSDLNQRIVEISGRRVYSIHAPVTGRLTTLQISEGQTIEPQVPIVAILQEGAKLYAELYLPTRAAGFITKGQTVWLRYGAFPYQHYGLYEGSISEVAQTILAPSEIPIPLALQEPVYRIKVGLNTQSVQAYGRKFPLQAGMLLEASIILEERSLGQWLLEPIYGLKGHL
jgi:membrane fusion protein